MHFTSYIPPCYTLVYITLIDVVWINIVYHFSALYAYVTSLENYWYYGSEKQIHMNCCSFQFTRHYKPFEYVGLLYKSVFIDLCWPISSCAKSDKRPRTTTALDVYNYVPIQEGQVLIGLCFFAPIFDKSETNFVAGTCCSCIQS